MSEHVSIVVAIVVDIPNAGGGGEFRVGSILCDVGGFGGHQGIHDPIAQIGEFCIVSTGHHG